jgi:hypothetical protein
VLWNDKQTKGKMRGDDYRVCSGEEKAIVCRDDE